MRTVGDDVQHGFQSTLANWPLILIGIAVQWFLGILLVISILAAIVPLLIAGIFSAAMLHGPRAQEAVENFVLNHPLIATYILLVIAVVLIPLMLIYAFAHAARCGILIDAEAKERTHPALPPRERFNAFDFNQWAEYGRRFWWRVFLIYNIVWGVYSIFLLLIVALAAGIIIYLFDQTFDAVAAGCAVGAISGLLLVAGAFLTTIWTQSSVIECVRRDLPAGAACRLGARLMRKRFGRFLLLQCLLIGISIAAGTMLMIIYFGVAAVDTIPGMLLLLLPLKIAGSLVQSAFGAALGNWYNASFVSATEDETALVSE